MDAAFEVDPTGDFGRLVLLAAATGARFSQLANLIILDFQLENGRLMMPSSRKGKNRQPGARRAVPVGIDVMRRILPVTRRRSKHEPLLLRWSHRKTGGPGNWTKDKRQAWRRADEIDELWAKTVALAGIPAETVMYALRHSSIVRGLKKNLPVRLVAALHDTSVEMPLQNPTYKLRYQPCLTDAGRADDKLRRPRGPDGSQCCLFRVVQIRKRRIFDEFVAVRLHSTSRSRKHRSQFGSIAGLLSLAIVLYDRLFRDRLRASITMGEYGPLLTVANPTSVDMTMTKYRITPAAYGLSRDASVGNIVRAAAGKTFSTSIKANSEKQFVLISLSKNGIKQTDVHRRGIVLIYWRRNSSFWFPQIPVWTSYDVDIIKSLRPEEQ